MKKEMLELYKEYDNLCEKNKLEYQPDGFLVIIHEHYLNNGKIKLPYPLYATWDITNFCNLHCSFCSAAALDNKRIIDDPNTLKIAEKIVKNGVKYVSIRGGEPTLIKQLPEIINIFNKNGIFTEVVSNGTYINDNFFKSIESLNKNLIRIKISLDSTIPELNDKIRSRGSYMLATNAMSKCNEYKFPYRVQMVITNENKRDVINMYNFVSERNCSSFGTMIMLPMGRGIDCEKVEIDEQLLKDLIYIKKHETKTKFEKLGMGIEGFKFYKYLYKDSDYTDEDAYKFSVLKCNCCKTRINIDANGDIYPCDMTKYKEFKLGNILEDSIDKFWNSENANKFNRISRRTKKGCKDCKIKGCNTGCFGMSYAICKSIKDYIPNCKLYDE